MERDCFYNELKYVRDYACKAAGLDSEIAGWKTAVDAMTKQLADAQEQVGSYKLVNDMHLKTVDKLSRQVEALQAQLESANTLLHKKNCAIGKAETTIEALQRERKQAEQKHLQDVAYMRSQYDSIVAMKDEVQAALDAEREKVKDGETAYKMLAEQWNATDLNLSQLQDWRDRVTLALQRAGGARFEDVPGHVKTVVDDLTQLQALVRALPVVRIDLNGAYHETLLAQPEDEAVKELLRYRASLDATTLYGGEANAANENE